jgi:hypothetical protein
LNNIAAGETNSSVIERENAVKSKFICFTMKLIIDEENQNLKQ